MVACYSSKNFATKGIIMEKYIQNYNIKEMNEENKSDIIKLINRMVTFCKDARKEGILSLEKDLPDIKDFFLSLGLKMLLSGYDAVIIKKTLNNLIIAENYQGIELLKKLIIKDGLFVLQEGYNPSVVEIMLYGYLWGIKWM